MEMERLLNRLDKMNDTMGEIKTELGVNSAQHTSMNKYLEEIKAEAKRTNGRVSSLERFKVKIIAYATVVSFIFTLAYRALI